METLPVEIVSKIIKYLNLADRREFALACRKFYEASLDPDLHWDSTYIFDAHALLPEDDQYYAHATFYCKSPNLYISGLSENLNAGLLVNPPNGCVSVLGPHVKRLSLKGSSILEGSFVEIIKKCEDLESLDVTGCKDLFMTGSFLTRSERYSDAASVLRTVTDLNLSSIRYLNNGCLRTFVKLCPELKSLSLGSCNILFSDFGSMQQHALTFSCILDVVKLRASTLIKIDLSRTGITNAALKELSSIKGLNLREVILQSCRELGDDGIIALAKSQPRMKILDIRGCLEIGNPALSAICTCVPNLKQLYISKCRKINDTSASKILFLDKLQVLDISECYEVTKCIPSILLSMPSLSTLVANGCSFTSLHSDTNRVESIPSEKKAILIESPVKQPKTFASLTKLSINSGKYVSDLVIQNIFMNLINLEHLSLSWCYYVTDRGLLGLEVNISENRLFPDVENTEPKFLSTGRYSTSHGRTGFLCSPGSEFMSLVDWSEVNATVSMRERGIGCLKNLKRLAISNCRNVTEESLIRIFCVGKPLFPALEHLELNMMRRSVTDEVLYGISHGCPLMTKLAISCSDVSDQAVDSVTSGLKRLESLNLSNCDFITPGFFTSLVKNTKWLRELDISCCKQIPAPSTEQLRKSLPLLTRIHTRYSGV